MKTIKNNGKRKTRTISIESGIIQKLQEKSDEENTSLNSLINHILKRYVDWDMFFERRPDMIAVSTPVVKEIFDNLNTKEVIRLATEVAKKAVYDTALFMKGSKMNPDIFISWFLLRMKNCSEIMKSIDENDGMRIYTLKHQLGENWSLYHKTMVESIFLEILHYPIHVSITDTTLTLKFGSENNV